MGDRRRFRPCGCDRLRARQRHGYPVLLPRLTVSSGGGPQSRKTAWDPLSSGAPRFYVRVLLFRLVGGVRCTHKIRYRLWRTTGLRAKQLPGVGCRLPLVFVLPDRNPLFFIFLHLSVSFEDAITEKTPLLDGPLLWLVVVAIFHAVVNLQVTVTLTLSTVCSKVLLQLLHMLYSPFAIRSASTSFDTTENRLIYKRTTIMAACNI